MYAKHFVSKALVNRDNYENSLGVFGTKKLPQLEAKAV